MKRPKVIVIAQNQPLDNDAHLREKMADAEVRAQRQSHRFPDLDLEGLQTRVHENLLRSLLFFDGRTMDLLDLMNAAKNKGRAFDLTRENVSSHYSLANTVTHNGIYLYQYLARHGYDPIIVQNYAVADRDALLALDPMAVCISSNFIYMKDILQMAGWVKESRPHIPVIAGGMLVKKVLHAGARLSAKTLRHFSTYFGKVDAFVVEAQGEQTLIQLLQTLRQGGDMGTVPNLALFDEKGVIYFTPREEEAISLDPTCIPWDTIPKVYLRKTLPVTSSRGCFYRCRFCTYHWLFPEVHYKSIDVLREELRGIQALDFVRHVRFTDDNFTASPARLKAVLEMMIQEGFDFTWSSFARASALTPDRVRLMKASGCEFVDLGLESGSQVILDNMDKKLSRDQSMEAIRMLNGEGIYSRGSFIIGYPGETRETFQETIQLINESGLPYYHPYLFYYSGNTLVHEHRTEFGLQGLGLAWKHHTMDSVEASELMAQMVFRIPHSYTDGQSYVEEIYKLLRGEGYSPEEILELFRLKRQLQVTMEAGDHVNSEGIGGILKRLQSLVK